MDPNDFEYIVQLRVRATSHLSPQSLSLFCYHKEYLVALRQHFIGYWQSRFALSRHASPHGCLLWASSCNAEERSNLLGITVAPPAVNTLLPTVTLAPVTNFNESLPAGLSVNVTGPQIEVITDVASLNGDTLPALGPDAAAALKIAYQENCPNGLGSPNCETSLQLALNVDQPNLQKRVVVFLVSILVVGMAIEFAEMRKRRM
ncbi:hypothetical protein HO173_001247 [Letharia columbiana]|uniref:Uncharacterized protein n=1 Tax=Letharia columbiana TaxID=112416 RepID=A0A8H6L9L0_9LECA|nr:uncharacterized protein HO173_001247 [Letharia columbiana]KAF6240576.1 hypothetical protein HO173_001247 [Letharia columbiana]